MKTGRPRMFNTPKDLWDAFLQYSIDTKANPYMVHDFVGKDGTPVYREKEKPLTFEGFKTWMFLNQADLGFSVNRYFDGTREDFVEIASHIKDIIRQDQVAGGMAGVYNSSLTARLNGLVDKTENKQMIEQPLFSFDETKAIDNSVKNLGGESEKLLGE
jgi:hypothetical protein